jgi:hypothetical protein
VARCRDRTTAAPLVNFAHRNGSSRERKEKVDRARAKPRGKPIF